MSFLLFIVALGLGLASQMPPGRSELAAAALICGLLALALILRDWIGLLTGLLTGRRQPERGQSERRKSRRREARAPLVHVVVDGSNVMHWKDGTPSLDTLREVLGHLTGLGFTPDVVFDANAGYKIAERHHDDRAFSQMLGLPRDRVMVVAKGTPADPVILAAARDMGARIVTNDRYRDWAETHPEVQTPGHLIRGGYRDGRLWLDLPEKP